MLNDGGQGTGSTTGTPPPAGSTPPPPAGDWTSSFDPDSKGFVENKGFKDPGELLTSYRNLEKLIGGGPDKLIKQPTLQSTPDEWSAFYDRLGRPKEAKEYEIKPPDGAEDTGFIKFAQENFHKFGLTKSQGEAVGKAVFDFTTQHAKQTMEETKALIGKEQKELEKEWGAANEQNTRAASNAAKAFGVKEEEINALQNTLGYKKTIEFFYSLSQKLGESNFHTGNAAGTGAPMTPAQASSKINELMTDNDWVSKYMAGSVVHQEEMKKLQIMANGGQE